MNQKQKFCSRCQERILFLKIKIQCSDSNININAIEEDLKMSKNLAWSGLVLISSHTFTLKPHRQPPYFWGHFMAIQLR